MNVKLNYKKSLFCFDVDSAKPISYIEELAAKVFNLIKEKVVLFFNEQQIMNTHLLIKDYFLLENNICLKVSELENLCQSANPEMRSGFSNTNHHWEGFNKKISYFNPKKETDSRDIIKKEIDNRRDRNRYNEKEQLKIKTTALLTQDSSNTNTSQGSIWKSREAIFFCRECNLFLCSSYQEHQTLHDKHKIICIDKGNLRQSTLIYKRDLINDIKRAKKDLQDSSAFNIDDTLFVNEANDVLLSIKKIIAKRDDIAIQMPSSTIKDYRLELLMTKIYSQFPNDDFFNESMETIFKMMNTHEKELKNIQEEIKRIKVKSDFRQMIFLIIRNINKILDKTFNDINSIYQKSLGSNSHCDIMMEIQHFLNKNIEFSKEQRMVNHTRVNSYNNYNHISLPIIKDKQGQFHVNDSQCYNIDYGNNSIENRITISSKNNHNNGDENNNTKNNVNSILNSREPKFNLSLRNKEVLNTQSGGFLHNLKMNSFKTPTKVFLNLTKFNKSETSQLKGKKNQLQQQQEQEQEKHKNKPESDFSAYSGFKKSLMFTEPNTATNNDNNSNDNPFNSQMNLFSKAHNVANAGLIKSVKADPIKFVKKKKKHASKLDVI